MPADNTRHSDKNRASGASRKENSNVRAQILAAAAELAREKGAAHISIEAIAQRAGLSKGGLLYHFPRKSALIQALVTQHLAEIEAELDDVEAASGHRRTNAIARAFVQVHRRAGCHPKSKPEGILVAFAENPDLLDPVRAHEKRLIERIRNTAADRDLSLIALLVIGGIRALHLFEMSDLLAENEYRAVLDRVLAMLADEQTGTDDDGTA